MGSGDRAADGAQIAVGRIEAGAGEDDVLVVAGDAFDNPEGFGVVFVFVLEGAEFDRTEAFAIPSVKILVAGQREPGGDATVGATEPAIGGDRE